MNTKRLITASIFSLISASTALAADVLIPHQTAPSTPSSTIVAPAFSWTGLYLGVQAGGFSSKADLALVGQEKSFPLDKEFSPKLSGFAGGFYAGSNIDLGDSFIFGIDTDLTLSGKKHTKTITIGTAENVTVENAVGRSRRSAEAVQTPTPGSTAQSLAGVVLEPLASEKTASAVGTSPASAAENSASGTGTPAADAKTPSSSGAGTPPALDAGTPSAKPSAIQSSQTQARQVNQAQQPNAGAGQSSQSAATGSVNSTKSTESVSVELKAPVAPTAASRMPSTLSVGQSASSEIKTISVQSLARSDAGGTSVNGKTALQLPVPKPTSSTTGASSPRSTPSLGRSDTGKQSSSAVSSVPNTPVKLLLTQNTEKAPVSSVLPTKSETNQPAVKAPTSGQLSVAERTVPTGPLALARSGSSNESGTKTSNGTNGTPHGGHHSAHGSGHSNPHGASHPGGHHGSGANPHGSHGAHPHASRPHGAQSQQAADKNESSVYGIEQMKKMASELGLNQEDEVETVNHTFKQNWGGATRVRIGFAADRFMPYLAGGIAYGQFQDTVSISVKGEDGTVVSSKNLTDETKTMIGYTVGGGVDFSVLDNVIVRAEYRYSDFGKKKFAKEKLEVNYKTNDFRVGVAYKF